MHNCSRDDDAGTELLDHGHDNTTTLESAEREEDGSEYSNGCRGKNGKHETNTQRDVVVARDRLTSSLYCVSIGVNAMPYQCQLRNIY